jgi:hypothetical protein
MQFELKYIRIIRKEMAAGRLPVSDAILLILKVCRGSLRQTHLQFLNRELLGYLEEEMGEAKCRQVDGKPDWLNSSAHDKQHRLLSGFWVSLTPVRALAVVRQPSQRDTIIYNEGMSELEATLDRVSISDLNWVSIAVDTPRNAAFMCSTSSLQVVYDGARAQLCDFIDSVAAQWAVSPTPDNSPEGVPLLLLKAQCDF